MFKTQVLILSFLFTGIALSYAQNPKSLYDISMPANDGTNVSMGDYKGKVMLIVNTASRCGFTSQYKGLEDLYQNYKDQGFVILAFPANDFMGQEPGSNEEIKNFCQLKYKTTFPLFAKSTVVGKDKNPLYKYLTEESAFKGEISWNFNKFLIDRKGQVVGRYESSVKPDDSKLLADISNALGKT